jgi:HEAT repeat protein
MAYSDEVRGVLRAAFEDADAQVREQVASAIGSAHTYSPNPGLAREFIPELIKTIDAPEAKVVIAGLGALACMGPNADRAIPQVLKVMDRRELRAHAVGALGAIGRSRPQALAAIMSCLSPKEELEVVVRALYAIEYMGPAAHQTVPSLIAALDDPRGEYTHNVRLRAVQALGKIGPAAKAAIPRLIQCFQATSSKPWTGEEFVTALESIDPPTGKRLREDYRARNTK